MSEIKLKPCPFCGSTDVEFFNTAAGYHEVVCTECCACSGIHYTKADAAEAWNRRTTETQKKGKWQVSALHTLNCSECGFEIEAANISKYCPNCGADMRGEE